MPTQLRKSHLRWLLQSLMTERWRRISLKERINYFKAIAETRSSPIPYWRHLLSARKTTQTGMATPQSEEISRDTAIWYFAYGSNMRSSVMSGRGIVPLAAMTVVVPTHVLTFDIFGIPYSEPSFASIAEVEHVDAADGKYSTTPLSRIHRPPVHGVAYLLSQEDHRRLVITEGGNVGYDVVELLAEVLGEDRSQNIESPGKRQIVVQTLKAKYPWRSNRAPSARYKVCHNFLLQSVR